MEDIHFEIEDDIEIALANIDIDEDIEIAYEDIFIEEQEENKEVFNLNEEDIKEDNEIEMLPAIPQIVTVNEKDTAIVVHDIDIPLWRRVDYREEANTNKTATTIVYSCTVCNKKYKSHTYFKAHQKKCKAVREQSGMSSSIMVEKI